MRAVRPSATVRTPPAAAPGQEPLDVRLEFVSRNASAHWVLGLPTFGGLIRYSTGEALSPVDRSWDLVITVAQPDASRPLCHRVAYHRLNGTACVGLLESEGTSDLPGVLSVSPAHLPQQASDLIHNLFAPFLDGLVCVDWHDVLHILDGQAPLLMASGDADDPEELGVKLAAQIPDRLDRAHAVLYGPAEQLRLDAIRAFVKGVRKASVEYAHFVYSTPFAQPDTRPFRGFVLGSATSSR